MSKTEMRPQPGQIWCKDGMYRVVVDNRAHGHQKITWKRPGSRKVHETWLMVFHNWMHGAELVDFKTLPPTPAEK